jgi:hypothetical protein
MLVAYRGLRSSPEAAPKLRSFHFRPPGVRRGPSPQEPQGSLPPICHCPSPAPPPIATPRPPPGAKAKSYANLDALAAPRRILLTGTPLQNDLAEYYALVSFASPGFLGAEPAFAREFVKPVKAGIAKEARTPPRSPHVPGPRPPAAARPAHDSRSLLCGRRRRTPSAPSPTRSSASSARAARRCCCGARRRSRRATCRPRRSWSCAAASRSCSRSCTSRCSTRRWPRSAPTRGAHRAPPPRRAPRSACAT